MENGVALSTTAPAGLWRTHPMSLLAIASTQFGWAPSKMAFGFFGLLVAGYVSLRALEIAVSSESRYIGPRAARFTHFCAFLVFIFSGLAAFMYLLMAR